MLSRSQQDQFRQQGYLLLPGFKTQEQVQTLIARGQQIVADFDAHAHRSVFSTQDQARRGADAAFLASAEGIQCFFEEHAFDDQGRLGQAKALSINKIGHALHDLDPVFDRFSRGPALAELAHDLGLQQPALWQSMLIFKQPGIGGEVKWHQDASFLHDSLLSVTTFWFALEDATLNNGCLWLQPGGHRGPLRERFERDGETVRMLALNEQPWPAPDDTDVLPLEVPAGTLVVFHGLMPHWSAANRSGRSRQAYTLHATDGRAHYASSNWLQRPRLALRGFEGQVQPEL